MENQKQEICVLPCKHVNQFIERIKVSVFYEENPIWVKGWHLMLEPESDRYECNDCDGLCFLMIPDKDKSEINKQRAISEAKSLAMQTISNYGMAILI